MRKILGILFALLVLYGRVEAQTTTVIGTMVDSDGTTWKNGSWSIVFKPNPSDPTINHYNQNGTPLSPTVLNQTGMLDNSGAFSVTVYDGSTITPVGSQWTLRVCPQATAPCGDYTFPTSGPTIDISVTLTTVIPAPRFKAVPGSYGYNSAEAVPQPNPGSTYYDVTSQCPKSYNTQTLTWSCAGATNFPGVSSDGSNGLTIQGATTTAAVNGRLDFAAGQASLDIGNLINVCVAKLVASTGGICSGASDNGKTNLVINTQITIPNSMANIRVELPCAIITTSLNTWLSVAGGANQISFTRACAIPSGGIGGIHSGGSYILWSGSGTGIVVGDTSHDTNAFELDGIAIDSTSANAASTQMDLIRVQHANILNNRFEGMITTNTQTLLKFDGGTNYSNAVISNNHFESGFIQIQGVGSSSTAGLNGGTIVGNYFNPLSITGSRALLCTNCDGTFLIGGDLENDGTNYGVELGANAQNNTIMPRWESAGAEVILDSGANNNKIQARNCQVGVLNLGSSGIQCNDTFAFRQNYNSWLLRSTADSAFDFEIQAGLTAYQQEWIRFVQGFDLSYWHIGTDSAAEFQIINNTSLGATSGNFGQFVLGTSASFFDFQTAGVNYGRFLVNTNGPNLNSPITGKYYFQNQVNAELDIIRQPGAIVSPTAQAVYDNYQNYLGATQWKVGMDSGNSFSILDFPNSDVHRILLDPGANDYFDPGTTSGSINFNRNQGSGAVLNFKGDGSSTIISGWLGAAAAVPGADITPGVEPTILYSAAGTPLPSCASSSNQGWQLVVKDATAPTYMGTYTSGGGITAAVICSFNGTSYNWLTH